jgi:Pterin binding enzyme
MSVAERVPFVVIGENIHATRTFSRQGRNIVTVDGTEQISFRDVSGSMRTCPIATPVAESTEFAKNRVKHVRNALLLGLSGDGVLPAELTGAVSAEAAQTGRDYLVAAAVRQQQAGAHYVDVNVDEIDADEGIRIAAMEWLVRLLQPALAVPVSVDSSSIAVLEAGLRASTAISGPILLNSASADRPEALDLAAAGGAAAVLSAAGRGALPSTVQDRLDNATVIYGAAQDLGLSPRDCHVDLLVIPVSVDGEAGNAFLEAARRFRADHGRDVRITGGLSNVSFGLPNRKLLNDTFLALAMDAGVDSGIIDPVAIDVARIRNIDRGAPPFQMAANVLTGADEFAIEYITAHRAGELAET